jgi:hypothetical protein
MADHGTGGAPPGSSETRVQMTAALSSAGANMRFARHAELLQRWPVLAEPWAQAIEAARLGSVDHTPGPATFGR